MLTDQTCSPARLALQTGHAHRPDMLTDQTCLPTRYAHRPDMLTDQTAFHVACFAFFALLRFVTATTTRKMADVLFVEDPGTLFTLEASYADGPVQVAHAVKLFSESKSNVTLLAVTLEEERWHLQLSDKCEGYMMGQKMLAGLWNSSDPSNIAIIFYEDKIHWSGRKVIVLKTYVFRSPRSSRGENSLRFGLEQMIQTLVMRTN